MKCASFLIVGGLLLAAGPTYAADDHNDFMNRMGRALQNDNDRDRDQSREYRDNRDSYGSSGYDRRGEDRRYDDRRSDDRRRDNDADRRDDDRDRR